MKHEQIWRFIDSGACNAAYNMAVDEAIAISVRSGYSPPTLRFYGWECLSASLGSFQKIEDIDIDFCTNNNIPVVRRPTGGRGILHGDELTYSFSARNEGEFSGGLLETYHKLSIAFKYALQEVGLKMVSIKERRESGRNLTRTPLCFKSTSFGEISLGSIKLIGSAQKRWSDAFLQQGSIPYSIDYEKTASVFKIPIPLHREKNLGLRELITNFDPAKFKEAIKMSFEKTFDISLADSHLSVQEQEISLLLLYEKYLNPSWTEGLASSRQFYNSSEMLKRAL